MRGGTRAGAGRKPVHIDLGDLEKLCVLHCTDEEIAAWFGVSTRTVEMRRKQPEFGETMSRGRAKGRISVRRAQMKLMEAGNATMSVWLGKQLLGQRDVTPLEVSGPQGEALKITLESFDALVKQAKQTKR
jgi:hypothetical protein